MKEISILGGGISGLSAAIKLADANYKVIVFDEKESHNEISHTSVLRNYAIPSSDALEEIRTTGITIKPENEINKVIKISPNFHSTVQGDKIYYSIRRGSASNSLEKQLYTIALTKGVTFSFSISDNKNPKIIASGHKHKPNIIGYGREYDNVNVSNDEVYLLYDNEIAPQGYLCIIPSKDNVTTILSVAFGTKLNVAMLRKMYERALQKNKLLTDLLDSATPVSKEIHGYSYYKKDPINTCDKNDSLYVGDAGGFQDGSRGFGIRYAILTGVFAATSIIEGQDYSKLLKEYFKDEFVKNYKRRVLFNTFTNADYDKMIKDMGERTSRNLYVSAKRNIINFKR